MLRNPSASGYSRPKNLALASINDIDIEFKSSELAAKRLLGLQITTHSLDETGLMQCSLSLATVSAASAATNRTPVPTASNQISGLITMDAWEKNAPVP